MMCVREKALRILRLQGSLRFRHLGEEHLPTMQDTVRLIESQVERSVCRSAQVCIAIANFFIFD